MKKTLFSFLVFLCTVSSFVATVTWTGGGTNNNWSNSQNWGGSIPVAGSLILKSADSRTVSYDIAAGAVLEYNTTGIGNTNSFSKTIYTGDGLLLKTGADVITWLVTGTTFALSANARMIFKRVVLCAGSPIFGLPKCLALL